MSRVKLGAATGGVHTLSSDQPVGLKMLGYAAYTSVEYPGGLGLAKIANIP